jgi:diguanylate cyclase (GGDEF)-like protein/PAS domain S-box-containing protein
MAVKSQSLARLLAEFPELVVVLDSSGTLLWANQMALNFFERDLGEATGQSVLGLVHPDDLELVLRSFESVQDKEIGSLIEVRVKVGADWRLIELVGVAVNWFGEGAVLFSLRDLTTRRRFEVAHNDTDRFRSLVHNAAVIIMLVSPSGYVESVSAALTRMLGHDPELVENEPLANIVFEEDRPALAAAMERALAGSTATHPVTQGLRLLRHADPRTVNYEMSIVNLIDDPTVRGLVVTAHDVSEMVSTELELRDTFSLLNATLESTADGLLVVDIDHKITSFNSRFAEMWRVPKSLLELGDDQSTLNFVLDQLLDPEEFLARVAELYSQLDSESSDTLMFKDGRVFERFSKPQYVSGLVVGRVWSFSDITEQKQLENDLAHLAFHDTLTGLANRALFSDRLNQAIARSERTGKYVAVLCLDLDNFKTINDGFGRSAGDELLISVAHKLSKCLRRSDTAARLGGDEFAVLVEDVDNHDEVIRLANRIMKVLRQPVTLAAKNKQVSSTASIGLTFGITGSTSEQLLRNADLAMHLAKAQGKDRYEEFQDQMHTAVLARLELEVDLRKAVLNNEFVVHYQPIFDVETGAIVGFEALVRWQHPTRGLLHPDSFIPFAEEIGVIHSIDHFVLGRACSQVRAWQDDQLAATNLLVSVNLSAREITDERITDSVAQSLHESGFEVKHLILEITESAVLRDIGAAVQNLQALRALGLRIALDDFGTGYSSISHLERLPIDILKIDKSFLNVITKRDNMPDLAQAIVQLAQTLGLVPIAEGVERPEQASRLRKLGCRLAQGYHLGMPLDDAATEMLLRSRLSPSPVTKAAELPPVRLD